MSYIGNTTQNQSFVPTVDYFNGDGATVAFTLSRPVGSVFELEVVVNNVQQNPSSAYTVSGSTITFTSAPSSGTNNIYVYYVSPNTQVVQPGQGTVQPSSLSTGGPTWNTAGNLGLGVTPSAWNSGYKALEIGAAGSSVSVNTANGNVVYAANSFVGASGSTYGRSSYAVMYIQQSNTGGHAWFTAPSGTAGNAISFTQAMTLDASANLQFNSGYGSVATAYGCRAWVNFNGSGTVAIRASGNVSSITDNGTGDYTVNFTTALVDSAFATVCNYSFVGDNGDSSYNVPLAPYAQNQTTSTVRIGGINYGSGALQDSSVIGVVILR